MRKCHRLLRGIFPSFQLLTWLQYWQIKPTSKKHKPQKLKRDWQFNTQLHTRHNLFQCISG